MRRLPASTAAHALAVITLPQARHEIAVAVAGNRDSPVLLGPKVRLCLHSLSFPSTHSAFHPIKRVIYCRCLHKFERMRAMVLIQAAPRLCRLGWRCRALPPKAREVTVKRCVTRHERRGTVISVAQLSAFWRFDARMNETLGLQLTQVEGGASCDCACCCCGAFGGGSIFNNKA